MSEWKDISSAPVGKVLLVYGAVPGFKTPRTVRASYYPQHTLAVADGYQNEDWAEEGPDGDSYMPAGWYEESHSEEAPAVTVHPTHWMELPLPPPPKGGT